MKSNFALDQVEISEPIHLIGIGGAGMSAIAVVLLEMGYRVEGSDIKESANVKRLRKLGAVVGIGHRKDNLGSSRTVVKSSAIRNGNPEIEESIRRNVKMISRAEMLAAIMDTREGIAVSGTHGKTTTSSMVASMLIECGADPSYLIGGELNEIGGNAHYGEGRYLVAEADESDGSLLFLSPKVIILTNVDSDHLDYFESLQSTEEVFGEFLARLPDDGYAVVSGEDENSRKVGRKFKESGGRVFFYGRGPENDYRIGEEKTGASGGTFTAGYHEESWGKVRIKTPGVHNMHNAMATLAIGHQLGLPPDRMIEGMEKFKGVRRRFELVGERNGIRVVDDYAHHPTEIMAVLQLVGEIKASRVVAVFQPHRYSRTRLLADEFGKCFQGVDLLIITDVYGAGEDPVPGVTGKLIVDSVLLQDPDRRVLYLPQRTKLAKGVYSLLGEGDLVITMGAGDVTQCAREIVELMESG